MKRPSIDPMAKSAPGPEAVVLTGAKLTQTVRKLDLSGFLRGVGDVRIAHDSHRRIRTGPASVVAGGG
jgi:hypothetical protein